MSTYTVPVSACSYYDADYDTVISQQHEQVFQSFSVSGEKLEIADGHDYRCMGCIHTVAPPTVGVRWWASLAGGWTSVANHGFFRSSSKQSCLSCP